MPHANTTESFLWRAAPRRQRARLLGAIAIALSCGALGVLAGRWSVERGPREPITRTAALIEAVARETQDKLPAAAEAPEAKAPEPQVAQPKTAAAPVVPVPLNPSIGSSRTNSAVTPEPAPAPPPAPREEYVGAGTRAASAPLPAGVDEPERHRPAASMPVARELRRPQLRPAPQVTTAPNYRALRDYVLNR